MMAGGANTINMWFDRDIDTKMARTQQRPIPAGRIPANAALLFGITLGITAFVLFWTFVHPLSAWLALAGLLFYVFVYTVWLKRTSPQNIVDRRSGRRVPAAGGLGGDDAPPRPGRDLPLCHHLLLDTAPLLGARPQQAARLRCGRRPDDAQRARGAGDQAPDAALHPHADPVDDHAGAPGRDRDLLRTCGRAPRVPASCSSA